jgi:hypothetical protein
VDNRKQMADNSTGGRKGTLYMHVTITDPWSDLGFITGTGVRASAFFMLTGSNRVAEKV